MAGRRRGRSLVAHAGDGGVRSWNGSLVVRRDDTGLTLWTPTGDRVFRFFSRTGSGWRRPLVYRGPAWSLTGIPAPGAGREFLLWRGARAAGRSDVMAAIAPAAG